MRAIIRWGLRLLAFLTTGLGIWIIVYMIQARGVYAAEHGAMAGSVYGTTQFLIMVPMVFIMLLIVGTIVWASRKV